MQKKLTYGMFVSGMVAGLLTLVLFVFHGFLPTRVIEVLPLCIGGLLGLLAILGVLQMVASKNIIGRLASLPMILAFSVMAYLMVKLPIYPMLMAALTGAAYEVDSDALFDTMAVAFKVLQFGIWISVVPMVVAGIALSMKTKSKPPKNIDDYQAFKAKILGCQSSNVRINNQVVFTLDLEIQNYFDVYQVKKDIRIPYFQVTDFQVASQVDVLVDPKKKTRVYIKMGDQYL